MEDNENINENFRLFLTSMPCDFFPVSILQISLKLTNEPPKGVKANMLKTYNNFNSDKLNNYTKPQIWQKFIFSLTFFHAII